MATIYYIRVFCVCYVCMCSDGCVCMYICVRVGIFAHIYVRMFCKQEYICFMCGDTNVSHGCGYECMFCGTK